MGGETLEDFAHAAASKEFISTSSSGNSAFKAQRSSNFHGCYLTIVEYRKGGKRDLIYHPERRDLIWVQRKWTRH